MSDCTRLIYDIMQIAENKSLPGLLLLIDFQKAFDSISWKFLYNTLQFFGLSEKFINWIKLFNKDIKMYVLQSGYLSEEICVGRGCRQGDPLSPYLFLFGAEIMALLFLMNPNIIGFKINSKEFKITQFADDTTLILDGSQCSLQAALNTLEIYGTFSGLKMNKEKTKVIWIGRKKYSKDKLNVSVSLDWGKVEFILLGIVLNVNLNFMPYINWNNVLKHANVSLKLWQMIKLIVLKSLIISKFIHIFLILPISESFVSKLNSEFFKFLWHNKPGKIKRTTVCSDTTIGGLKMVNIQCFIRSLKISWIRRIFGEDCQWLTLFNEIYGNAGNLFFENTWCNSLLQRMTNTFWMDVIKDWQIFCRKQQTSNNIDILNSCLWYNPQISREVLYFSTWFKNGIFLIGDIMNEYGQILPIEVLRETYNIKPNILDYHRIKVLVQNYIKKFKTDDLFYYSKPARPFHLQVLFKSKKGCGDFYKILAKNIVKGPIEIKKWEALVNGNLNDFWNTVYKICFKSVPENKYVWFQYRIIHNILDTKYYLHKVKISECNKCQLCGLHPETIGHLFSQCSKVVE